MTQSRRDFLKALAGATAGTSLLMHSRLWAQETEASKVVIARHEGVITPDGERDREALEALVDGSMRALTGEEGVTAQWRAFFEPADIVGLKVNCLAGYGLSTHYELVNVVTDRLQSAGLPPENIIVWERTDRELIQGGFEPSADGPGPRCLATNGEFTEEMSQGEWSGRVSKLLAEGMTALINLPILKDHNVSGLAGALKNHYGSFDRPSDYHDNNCDPYIADLNALPLIRDKQRLIICDATVGCYDGGPTMSPQYLFEPKSLLVSADAVALDYQGWRIVEAGRKENGMPPLEAEGRYPQQIDSAAERGLGTNDEDAMNVVALELA